MTLVQGRVVSGNPSEKLYLGIVNADMVWKLGELQKSTELRFYVELALPCFKSFKILPINISIVRLSASERHRYWRIALLYQKFIVVTVHKSA